MGVVAAQPPGRRVPGRPDRAVAVGGQDDPIDAFPDVTNIQSRWSARPGAVAPRIERFVTYHRSRMRGLPASLDASVTKYASRWSRSSRRQRRHLLARQLVFERCRKPPEGAEGVETTLGPVRRPWARSTIHARAKAGFPARFDRRLAACERCRTGGDAAPRAVPGVAEVNSFWRYLQEYQVGS